MLSHAVQYRWVVSGLIYQFIYNKFTHVRKITQLVIAFTEETTYGGHLLAVK